MGEHLNTAVSCKCTYYQIQLTHRLRKTGIHWFIHIWFALMRVSFLPRHAYYYESGFTSNEVEFILNALEFLKVDKRRGSWNVDSMLSKMGVP
ncbi:hypothetical protein CYMTET_40981 [Cymbomonas tetramitiformis]|uniref:Uncharacterized protein n=1 Tax=Cymbomonas tetramitiformis TaxID=36881 RepID=A0AAE0F2E4_9CHLO|nr:hypothetical protein CYMTET_40981 [Cymbomonas tetramitiformis]